MDIFDGVFQCSLLGVSFLFGCIFFLQRLRWKRNGRKGTLRRGFYPSSAALGNALHNLQTIPQPHMKYVVAEKLEEHEDEEDETGPKDPTAHLKRQLRRIQNGEEIDELVILRGPLS